MDEFENQNNNNQRPDYYQPNGGSSDNQQSNYGTYYKPPTEDTTYHYSYRSPNEQQSQQQSSYYTPPQSNYNQNSSNGSDNQKPPKKSKAAIVIIVILAVCLIIAGASLAISGFSGLLNDSNSNNTSQSDHTSDTKLNDSEEVPLKDNDNKYTVAGVAEKCKDSCVGITVYSEQASAYNYFFGYGQQGGSTEPTLSGEGSGVIMSEGNGKTYIITCAHVIEGGDSFKITLDNKKEYDAFLVGTDAQTDIGVLAINETGLNIAEFANSEKLVVGEQVVAIGCPGGLEFMNSTTSGYISALDRPISSGIGYDNKCIQIDAAINPGNSGGALFNMQGQVIGINSSKIASMEYEGMGFAVPSKTAVDTANSLIRVGYVEGRAKIGINYNPITSFNNSSTIIEALADKGFKDAQGAMVINEIEQSSDLASKDIRKYDMIIAVNGDVLTSTDVMTSVLSESSPGDTIKLTIARIENNEIKIKEVDCKLIESKG